MKNITDATLAVKFCGNIEASSLKNRESFRQGVIDTVIKVLRMQNVTIEYIAYQPDQNKQKKACDDCVVVSMNMKSLPKDPAEEKQDRIIDDFIRVFEHHTHKHLKVNSTKVIKDENLRLIEMQSNWDYFLKHG